MLRKIGSAAMAACLISGGLLGSLSAALGATPPPPWDPFFAAPATSIDFGAATRPFGVAAGDFDADGDVDLVIGRTTGHVAFVRGNGDGSFMAPTVYAWKQAFFNAWSFAPADVNGDGELDLVWGASATSSGCSVSPVPTSGCPLTVTVNDGDVRAFLGNGDGSFQEVPYFVSGVRHNAGVPIGDLGIDAGSVAVADVDGDADMDVVAGATDGTNSVVRILRNGGAFPFAVETLISQPSSTSGDSASPTYFPATSTQNSPWGLAFGDVDADGDADLFVGDRALYIYLYRNDGAGSFSLKTDNTVLATRPNVYVRHDTFRAAVGFTPSLATGDVNGDGRADIIAGLQSGAQTPASGIANDGVILLDVSTSTGHASGGKLLADVGSVARGVSPGDVNGDGALDILAATYEGQLKLLRQLPPVDDDGDGVSDYVDNALGHANSARLDMNTDGSINERDQLDNDFDTVAGDPEDPSTWQRLGDPADPDDDNDGVSDLADVCAFVPDAAQADADADGRGDACDALDDRDADGDGVPTGPMPGEPLYEEHLAAKQKWASGSTRFVLRIDALSRFFQNEFTQLMTDAAILSPDDWAVKCWENYDPGDAPSVGGADPTYEPCGTGEGTADQTLTLDGGRGVPIALVVIPKQLWTDPGVVAWINDRNANPNLEIGQHGTYHPNNTPLGDWAGDAGKGFYQCETCGFTLAEMVQLLEVGRDTLTGDYGNKWVADAGATPSSPKIDWTDASQPLIAYAAPFNTSDATSREALAQLGYKAFSASQFEEDPASGYGQHFADDPSSMERFGPSGMFHASADWQIDPPEFDDDDYSATERQAYDSYLHAKTQAGGLNTWLIEEVEWSGRICNNQERLSAGQLTDCNGQPNREDNTVYGPRWVAWLQLLDFVRAYPDGVVMTLGEAALAQAFDNAPTIVNAGQADADHDGIGDVAEGATLDAASASVRRNVPSTLAAILTNGAGEPIAAQTVTFAFDADGDGGADLYTAQTDSAGRAEVSVTATRPVGSASFEVRWDSLRGFTATDTGSVSITDGAYLALDGANPSSGQVTDQVAIGATLTDSDGIGISGRSIAFTIGTASGSATTDEAGYASATLTLAGPAGASELTAAFTGDSAYSSADDSSPFTVEKEDSSLVVADAVGTRRTSATAAATLSEADGAALAGRTVEFFVEEWTRAEVTFTSIGTAVTDTAGVATVTVPIRYVTPVKRIIRAVFSGDADFLGASGEAFVYRQ